MANGATVAYSDLRGVSPGLRGGHWHGSARIKAASGRDPATDRGQRQAFANILRTLTVLLSPLPVHGGHCIRLSYSLAPLGVLRSAGLSRRPILAGGAEMSACCISWRPSAQGKPGDNRWAPLVTRGGMAGVRALFRSTFPPGWLACLIGRAEAEHWAHTSWSRRCPLLEALPRRRRKSAPYWGTGCCQCVHGTAAPSALAAGPRVPTRFHYYAAAQCTTLKQSLRWWTSVQPTVGLPAANVRPQAATREVPMRAVRLGTTRHRTMYAAAAAGQNPHHGRRSAARRVGSRHR